MLKIKKKLAFAMAMIICILSCLTSVSALNFVDKELPAEFFEEFFATNDSFAEATMTNRGPNEEYTNLAAYTDVDNEFWWDDQYGNTTEVEAFVVLDIQFDAWHPDALFDSAHCGAMNAGATASAYGSDLDDFDHWVEGFHSEHYIYKYERIYNPQSGRYEYEDSQWGDTIYFNW